MPKKHSIRLGKMVRSLARLRSGGSALPGLFVERIEPNFLKEALGQLEHGVVLVSGTNGKTTTTKMVSELLAAAGMKVFTNRTGSNFTRGIVSSLIESMDNNGALPYDVAVLELDEAHAVHFVKQVQPRVSLLLNVMRDQLDRFGEIDHTARLLRQVAAATTETLVLNRDDPLVAAIAETAAENIQVHYFGAHDNLKHLFPSDDQLKGPRREARSAPAKAASETPLGPGDTELVAFKEQKVAFKAGKSVYRADLKLSGFYNFLNAAAALTVARVFRPKAGVKALVSALEKVEPAFGRGERVMFHDRPVEFVLVKNPSGFRLSLASSAEHTAEESVMIAINDDFADGRDMSWLWDVDFASLRADGAAMVSGTRGYDMALRLQYDNVTINDVETDLAKAFPAFLSKHAGRPMRIYCTYTAMLKLRALASKQLQMERAL